MVPHPMQTALGIRTIEINPRMIEPSHVEIAPFLSQNVFHLYHFGIGGEPERQTRTELGKSPHVLGNFFFISLGQTVEIQTQFLVPRTSAQKRLVSAIVKRRMPLHLGTQRSGNQKQQKQQLKFFT